MFGKFDMKKLVLMVSFFVLTACYTPQEDVLVFDVDYVERYEETLNAMFGYEWTLLAVEEQYVSIEEVHLREMVRSVVMLDPRPEQFITWTIEYRDGNGDVRYFVLENRSGFEYQVERHVESYILEFYRENFFDVEAIGASSGHLFGSILRLGVHSSLSGDQELDRVTREYRSLLATPAGTIRFADLTPANVFEMVPFQLWVSLAFDESTGLDQQYFEENVLGQIEKMLEEMNEFTSQRLNARVSMTFLTNEAIRVHHLQPLYYIQGEQVFEIEPLDFQRYIFESYRGIFW